MPRIKIPDLDNSEEKTCKGLFFRGRRNTYYVTDEKVVQSFEAKLLKRKSCPGCEKCYGLWDWLESVDYSEYDLTNLEDGKLYTVECVVTSTDYDSGLSDDWFYKFNEVKEKKE